MFFPNVIGFYAAVPAKTVRRRRRRLARRLDLCLDLCLDHADADGRAWPDAVAGGWPDSTLRELPERDEESLAPRSPRAFEDSSALTSRCSAISQARLPQPQDTSGPPRELARVVDAGR